MIEIPKKFDIEKARIARANQARREQIEQNELEIENMELKAALRYERQANESLRAVAEVMLAENKQLRGIILTIFALECNLHKMVGHECFAKHWALSLLDRVKRMKKGKTSK